MDRLDKEFVQNPIVVLEQPGNEKGQQTMR